MIAYHVEKGADITVGVVEVPASESRHFGVLTATEWNRVTRFSEKPAVPDTLPTRPDTILASMGIYVFNTRLLQRLPGKRMQPTNLPLTISARTSSPILSAAPCRCSRIRSRTSRRARRATGVTSARWTPTTKRISSWCTSTLSSTSTTRTGPSGPIRCTSHRPSSFSMRKGGGAWPSTQWSPVAVSSPARSYASRCSSRMCAWKSARPSRSAPSSCRMRSSAAGCQIRGAIIDEGCEIPDGMRIGLDRRADDARRFLVTENGVVLVTADMLRRLSD